LLTHHDIERASGEGQSHGIAFTPFHGRSPGAGEREHSAVEVEPNDVSSCAYLRRRLPGHYSGATCHIEYAFTGLQRYEIEESWYPRSENGGHHVTLIDLGGRFSWLHLGLAIHSET
jgi:hypothetical protein